MDGGPRVMTGAAVQRPFPKERDVSFRNPELTGPSWAEFSAGSEEALAQAYKQFAPLVFSVSLRSLGDRHAAADATQEVFIRAWRFPSSRPCSWNCTDRRQGCASSATRSRRSAANMAAAC